MCRKLSMPLLLILATGIAIAQEYNPEAISQKVNEIVERRLAEGYSTNSQGAKMWTRVPASRQTLDELKQLGSAAVTPLAEYTRSKDARIQRVAVELLGNVGGPEIIAPLKEVLLTSKSQLNRYYALGALVSAPRELILPILKQVKDDPDTMIRQKARQLLAESRTMK